MLEQITKDKSTAVRKAFIGGFFGLHDFYLGRTKRATIRSVVMGFLAMGIFKNSVSSKHIGVIPVVIIVSNIIEGFRLMSMSQHDFDLKFNPHLFVKAGEYIPTQNLSVADEILKLNGLFEKNLITFEEFEKRKKKLLG